MDIEILKYFNDLALKSEYLDALFIFIAVYFVFILAFFHFLYLRKIGKINIWLRSWLAVGVAYVLKKVIGMVYFRLRPFAAMEGINNLIGKSAHEASFPSGHTIIAFTLAFSIFWLNKKWGSLFLVGAFLVAVSRIIVGVHYPTDILGGIAIAFLVSLIFKSRRLDKR
ncbi:MAG: phosphatase PAP2 family protein [Patescibacteria group bacterium]